jgi:hypothetical protein
MCLRCGLTLVFYVLNGCPWVSRRWLLTALLRQWRKPIGDGYTGKGVARQMRISVYSGFLEGFGHDRRAVRKARCGALPVGLAVLHMATKVAAFRRRHEFVKRASGKL